MLVRVQAFVSKALFSQPAQVIKLGSCITGFTEMTSGPSKSCQLVGWDVCSLADWRTVSPNTAPAHFDLNMDAVFATPQLSGENFGYTRLPHVSHGVFCSGPIGGSYALPSNPSDALIAQLTSQHLAQAILYGRAPTAVAHIPPPPGRGRSQARGASRVRAFPPAADVAAGTAAVPARGFVGS